MLPWVGTRAQAVVNDGHEPRTIVVHGRILRICVPPPGDKRKLREPRKRLLVVGAHSRPEALPEQIETRHLRASAPAGLHCHGSPAFAAAESIGAQSPVRKRLGRPTTRLESPPSAPPAGRPAVPWSTFFTSVDLSRAWLVRRQTKLVDDLNSACFPLLTHIQCGCQAYLAVYNLSCLTFSRLTASLPSSEVSRTRLRALLRTSILRLKRLLRCIRAFDASEEWGGRGRSRARTG